MTVKGHSDRVAAHFESDWEHYDAEIRAAVPFYDQALTTLTDVLAAAPVAPARILEIGVGTGNLASVLLATFPEAHLTGIDLVEEFLDVASQRLSADANRIALHQTDVVDLDFTPGFDLVVSSFTVHHLDDDAKKATFPRIFDSLSSGGSFVNADYVGSASSLYRRIFHEIRLELLQKSGYPVEKYLDHLKLDVPVPMEAQLRWLRELGFVDTECFWKYLNLAVFGARKPGAI